MRVPFWKVESVGNDFVLIHEEDAPADLHGFTRSVCERRFGVGSDGLLVVAPTSDGLRMRMFNPDGSEDFCGNGLRCAAIHARSQGWVGETFTMHHLGRVVPATVDAGDIVETQIGTASYRPEDVPHRAKTELFNAPIWPEGDTALVGSALSTGSTHVIIPVSALPDDELFESTSPQIETSDLYPERTSVIWTMEEGPDKLQIRIWERGAGETLGCGTGASAAAVDYLRRTNRGGKVEVESRGGSLQVAADAWDAPIVVRGTAEELFSGVYDAPL